MDLTIKQLTETVSFLKNEYPQTPEIGIVLGSGLGNFIAEIQAEKVVDYDSIPNFPVSTVEGHHGKLIFGTLNGKKVVAMAGRFHYYEGYNPNEVVFPIRVMKLLGIQSLIITNASGGVNPSFNVGDLMIITDHISFLAINPLLGKNPTALGPRFPDMSEPYNKQFIQTAKQIASRLKINIKEGVYFGVTGPTFETRAEYKTIHIMGGDAVGMSTVQEVIVANHMNLPVFAVSVITDIGIREEENIISHDDVLHAAKSAEPKMTELIKEMVAAI